MINVVIVDDEPLARDILQSYVNKLTEVNLVGICNNALEAFAILSKEKVDVMLLDINMPEVSGMDFLASLKNPPLVIFTTAYHQYAVASYELNAVDYLLKPFSFERFEKAWFKAKALMQTTSNVLLAQQVSPEKMMFVRTEGKWVQINLNQLWLVEGLKDYIRLWIANERITVHSTMKNFEEQLKAYPNFIRVHKSFVVNLEFVKQVTHQTVVVNDKPIAIGSTYKDEVWKVLQANRLV